MPWVLTPDEPVGGGDHLDLKAGEPVDRLEHRAGMHAHDVGEIAEDLVLVLAHVHLVIEQHPVQGTKAPEGVAGEQHLLPLLVGGHGLRPVDERDVEEFQDFAAEVDRLPVGYAAHPIGDPVEAGQHGQGGVLVSRGSYSALQGNPAFDMKNILHTTVEHIESLSHHHGDVVGIPTGFKQFDNITNGFQKADLVIIAGRPSMGKTALALSMMRNMSLDYNANVGFFSLEMSQEGIAMRLLSMESGIDHQQLRRGKIPPNQWEFLTTAAGKINDATIHFDFTANLNVLDMRSRARRLKSRLGKLDIIFVDYLQIAHATVRKNDSRVQEVAMISQQLKALAKELNIPVIALSQLSRAPEQRGGDGRPKLSDLRDSGAIEQDADLVMFIHRQHYYSKDPGDEGKGELIIAKHRNGPTGSVNLIFKSEIVRFFDAPYDSYAQQAEEMAM